MRAKILIICLLAVLAVRAAPATAATSSDMRIHTYPIGLVTGELPVEVDLGAGGEPAELYLDGQRACTLTAATPRCAVDLGPDLHVHLLELVRVDATGRVVAQASRWVNRPGQEAELALRLGRAPGDGVCGGDAMWSHPEKKDPVLLQVFENGRSLIINGRSFRFPCPDPRQPHILTASAIFPDGRRAETVELAAGYGSETETQLTAIPVVGIDTESASCAPVKAALGASVEAVQQSTSEVVFILDPSAGYNTLQRSGWHGSALPTTTSTTKAFDSMVVEGRKGDQPTPKASWKRTEASLIGADKLWFVAPDAKLSRINGFASGKPNWLRLLFNFGGTKMKGKPRLADAVAASGLVAAAGPRPRAVVLILGSRTSRDDSIFSPAQARAYLAEVGVPLVVLRNGRGSDDGWPRGLPIHNMEAMADALEGIKADLERQCVAWFPGMVHPRRIADSLPEHIVIAGSTGDAPQDVEAVWARAVFAEELAATDAESFAGERVEVTAVTVLVMAEDGDGQPIPDLTLDELSVLEDGRKAAALELDPVATADTQVEATPEEEEKTEPPASSEAMPVAIYVDRKLSGSIEIGPALQALAARTEWLTSLGPVDVVVADQTVETVAENISDPYELQLRLLEMASITAGQHAVETIRTRFLRDIRTIPNRLVPDEEPFSDEEIPNSNLIASLQEGDEPVQLERSMVLNSARSSIFEEDGVLRLAAERVTDWALAAPAARPRVLLAVGAGFDEDPVEFYLPFVEQLESQNLGSAQEEFKRFRQAIRIDGVGRELAAAGWLVVPVATRTTGAQTNSASRGGGDRFQAFMSAAPEAIRARFPEFLMLDPIGSQRHLAAPSGGEVAMGGPGLDKLAAQTAGWYRLTYQLDRAPDGAHHALEVTTTRAGAVLRSTSVIATETSEGQASLRVRRLLRGADETGRIAIEVAITEPLPAGENLVKAEATVRVNLAPLLALLEPDGHRPVRVSVGVRGKGNDPYILHRIETVDGNPPGWGYVVPLQWPAGPTTMVFVVEDLGSGAWGAVVSEL